MSQFALVALHLYAAIMFVSTVFFAVLKCSVPQAAQSVAMAIPDRRLVTFFAARS